VEVVQQAGVRLQAAKVTDHALLMAAAN